LFVRLDSENASCYINKIPNIVREQTEFLKLSEEQIKVVKQTPRSVNSTSMEVSQNKRLLSEALQKIAAHINECGKVT